MTELQTPAAEHQSTTKRARAAWWTLGVLTFVSILDWADRALISVVAEPLRHEFELSDTELDHFTSVDMVDRAALAVELHDEFTAWASYERWPGRNEAEAAFMVADDHHGQGIATLLLEHLAAIARSNGIEHFTAEVLADNRAMLAVFAKAGWPLQRNFESGVVDLDWALATTDEFLDSVDVTPILVATKLDKLAASKRKPAISALKREIGRPVIAYSSVLGDGRDALWERILSVSSIDASEQAAQP